MSKRILNLSEFGKVENGEYFIERLRTILKKLEGYNYILDAEIVASEKYPGTAFYTFTLTKNVDPVRKIELFFNPDSALLRINIEYLEDMFTLDDYFQEREGQKLARSAGPAGTKAHLQMIFDSFEKALSDAEFFAVVNGKSWRSYGKIDWGDYK